jgi:hypothetical protein
VTTSTLNANDAVFENEITLNQGIIGNEVFFRRRFGQNLDF